MDLKENLVRMNVFLKDKDKKNPFKMSKEVISLWLKKGRFPMHYFGRFLYRNEFRDPGQFLDMKEYNSLIDSKKYNVEEYVHLLGNKLLFSLICEKHKLPAAPVLAYNLKSDFFVGNTILRVQYDDDLINSLEKIFESGGTEQLFVKSLCGSGGKNVMVLRRNAIKGQIQRLKNILVQDSFVYQVPIEQHEKINRIYGNSVNTMRIDTFIDMLGGTHILGIAMRFGSNGGEVDNVSSGGFFVPVNPKNGTLGKKGTQAMIHGGKVYYKHPDTGFVFDGFKIPFFKESCDLCLKFSRHIPNPLAGWDVAITPAGPVMIEGNHRPYLFMGEIGYGGYKKHPLYRQLMSDL